MFAGSASAIRPVLLALGALSLSGCWAEVSSRPAYAEVDYVPADIEVYPHTVYEGETVYWVGDHWYSPRGPHWVYYRHEPPGLTRYRARAERAPHARRWEYHERAAPHAPRREYREYYGHARSAPRREYHERDARRRYAAPREHAHRRPERYRD